MAIKVTAARSVYCLIMIQPEILSVHVFICCPPFFPFLHLLFKRGKSSRHRTWNHYILFSSSILKAICYHAAVPTLREYEYPNYCMGLVLEGKVKWHVDEELSACFMVICPFGPQASAALWITHCVCDNTTTSMCWLCLSYSNWLLFPVSSLDRFLVFIFQLPVVIFLIDRWI